jgi:4-hydroxy-tetrahydrodipicolinate synthase
VLSTAAVWRAVGPHDDFLLLAGTGCANAPETIELSRAALDEGYDAVLLLPPFFFKSVGIVGTTRAFATVLEALPDDARALLYHIPQITGVPVSPEVVSALRAAFGPLVAGLKDSGADLAATERLLATFPELAIFTGTDNHLPAALDRGAVGAITALASVAGAWLRTAYDQHTGGGVDPEVATRLTALRAAADAYPLCPAVKALLPPLRDLPLWPVRPPLVDLAPAEQAALHDAVAAALG